MLYKIIYTFLDRNHDDKNSYDDLKDELYESHTYSTVWQKIGIDYGESILGEWSILTFFDW